MARTTDKLETQVAVIAEQISTIKTDVTDIKNKLENNYVTQEEFKWVRNVVYGMVGIILVVVLGALLKLVVYGN